MTHNDDDKKNHWENFSGKKAISKKEMPISYLTYVAKWLILFAYNEVFHQ